LDVAVILELHGRGGVGPSELQELMAGDNVSERFFNGFDGLAIPLDNEALSAPLPAV
jgi:hypothetical protein